MKARLNNILALITLLVSSVTVPAKAQESQLEPSYDSRKEKYGYRIKGTRNEVIPPRYSRVEEFYKGKAVVMNDDLYGIIDEKGKAVFPMKSKRIIFDRENERYRFEDPKTAHTGVMDLNLNIVIPPVYYKVNKINKVYIVERYLNGNFCNGAFGVNGEELIPVTIPRQLEESWTGYISERIEGNDGILKTTGELIVPFVHRSAYIYPEKNIIIVSDTVHTCYLLDMSGKKISDRIYNSYKLINDRLFAVCISNKWGFITRNSFSIDCLYDEPDTSSYENGYFVLSKNKKMGVIDTAGREVIPFTYDKIIRYPDEMYQVWNNDKTGIADASGKIVVPCRFESVPASPGNGGFVLLDSRKKLGGIGIDGKELVPFVIDEEYVRQNYKTASAYLSALLKIDPKNPEIIYLDALGACSNLKPEQVLPILTGHVEKFGSNVYAPYPLLYFRSKTYTDLNNFKDAENDAMWANAGSVWGSKAYIYMGDKKFNEQDFKAAEHYYLYAGLYQNEKEAKEHRNKAIEELKKRGQWVEPKLVLSKPEPPIPDLPVALMNFTTDDLSKYEGNYQFRYLFTYQEALENCPRGYRMPEAKDWVNLIEYIMKDKRITPSTAWLIRGYIGENWNTESTMQEGFKTVHYSYHSHDDYKLNIGPLRRHGSSVGISDYMRSHDIIRYWFKPGEINGKMANIIEFNSGGFEWYYAEDNQGSACVRYIKK